MPALLEIIRRSLCGRMTQRLPAALARTLRFVEGIPFGKTLLRGYGIVLTVALLAKPLLQLAYLPSQVGLPLVGLHPGEVWERRELDLYVLREFR